MGFEERFLEVRNAYGANKIGAGTLLDLKMLLEDEHLDDPELDVAKTVTKVARTAYKARKDCFSFDELNRLHYVAHAGLGTKKVLDTNWWRTKSQYQQKVVASHLWADTALFAGAVAVQLPEQERLTHAFKDFERAFSCVRNKSFGAYLRLEQGLLALRMLEHFPSEEVRHCAEQNLEEYLTLTGARNSQLFLYRTVRKALSQFKNDPSRCPPVASLINPF